jgi:hypothetical protein
MLASNRHPLVRLDSDAGTEGALEGVCSTLLIDAYDGKGIGLLERHVLISVECRGEK